MDNIYIHNKGKVSKNFKNFLGLIVIALAATPEYFTFYGIFGIIIL